MLDWTMPTWAIIHRDYWGSKKPWKLHGNMEHRHNFYPLQLCQPLPECQHLSKYPHNFILIQARIVFHGEFESQWCNLYSTFTVPRYLSFLLHRQTIWLWQISSVYFPQIFVNPISGHIIDRIGWVFLLLLPICLFKQEFWNCLWFPLWIK